MQDGKYLCSVVGMCDVLVSRRIQTASVLLDHLATRRIKEIQNVIFHVFGGTDVHPKLHRLNRFLKMRLYDRRTCVEEMVEEVQKASRNSTVCQYTLHYRR